MSSYISSRQDLNVAIDNNGDLGDAERAALVQLICDDDDRPRWGSDWGPYLQSIDLDQSILDVARRVQS
jgi:hypothetical protein